MGMGSELRVDLVMTPKLAVELEQKKGIVAFVQEAYPVIESAEVANAASTELRALKAQEKWLDENEDKFLRPAMEIIATAKAFFGGPRQAVKLAIGHLSTKLLDWQDKERLRAEQERRERDLQERKIREKAAADAAAARAKAEQEAAEKRRQAEAAEAERAKLEREGNAKAAAKAAAESARRAEEAKAAEAAGAQKAAAIEAKAAAETSVALAPAPERVIGFSGRKNWKAELGADTTDQQAILKIVAALPSHPEYVAYLNLDWTSLNKSAKSLEANFNVPGLVAVNRPVGVSR